MGGTGPRVAQSGKRTKKYSRRIILVFIVLVGILLAMITMQARIRLDNQPPEKRTKNYQMPQASGFAELAANMRRDRRPVQVIQAVPSTSEEGSRTQRIVIEGTKKVRIEEPVLPRYYSNRDDAQAASTFRMMKMQALVAKPVADGFGQEGNGPASTGSQGNSSGSSGGTVANRTPQVMDFATMAALTQQGGVQPDPNGQAAKQNFLRDGGGSMTPQGYSQNLPVPQQFPYELKAGTIIPGLLISGINSDLPGNVIGQVSENVWDTATGKFILIPKGTRILGVYDSQVSFGQKRVLLVWNRLIFPNGTTLDIARSAGTDQAGYSGLSGRVDEHWGTMLKSALLASMFVAGAEIVYDGDSQGNNDNKSPGDVAAESVAGAILDMGTKIMNRASNIQPTITIRPGKKMGIFVQQDIVFPFPYF
jgi:type IV secretion system protein VirB10